jgi:predicted RND superfamily exporter protein
MYLSGIEFTLASATLGTLMGIGVEYTILLMMRYYEEHGKGEAPTVAITTAITNIDRAIIASAPTTIVGFGALLAATDFPVFVS